MVLCLIYWRRTLLQIKTEAPQLPVRLKHPCLTRLPYQIGLLHTQHVTSSYVFLTQFLLKKLIDAYILEESFVEGVCFSSAFLVHEKVYSQLSLLKHLTVL